MIHFIARAPFTPGGNFKSNWAWNDKNMNAAPDQRTLEDVRRVTLRQHNRYNTCRDKKVGIASNG